MGLKLVQYTENMRLKKYKTYLSFSNGNRKVKMCFIRSPVSLLLLRTMNNCSVYLLIIKNKRII